MLVILSKVMSSSYSALSTISDELAFTSLLEEMMVFHFSHEDLTLKSIPGSILNKSNV